MKRELQKSKLGDLLIEFTKKNKTDEPLQVYSVTNNHGFTISTEYFTKEVFSKNLKTYKIVESGDFAYNPSRINVGSIDYFRQQGKGLVSPLYVTFKTQDNILDCCYLKYFLKGPFGKAQIRNNTSGSVRDTLSFKQLSRIEIPLLSLEDQKRIVKILDQTDLLRQKRKQSIELLDKYLKSVFQEMFGNLFINNKKWVYSDLGNHISVLTDYHANGSYETLKSNVTLLSEPDYALMVRTTDLENNNFTKNVNYIDKHAYDFLEKSKVFGGEIIINKIGSAGKVYMMPKLNRPVSLGMNAFLLRFNENVNTIFMYYLLTSSYGETIIQKKVQGAVTKTIRKDAIRGLQIPEIPPELQNKFATIVEKSNNIKQKMLSQSENLENNFQALMQKAFKGELL